MEKSLLGLCRNPVWQRHAGLRRQYAAAAPGRPVASEGDPSRSGARWPRRAALIGGAAARSVSTEPLLVNLLGGTPVIRMVDFLIENSPFDYTKTEIAENAGIARASLYKVWPEIELYGIVKESRKIGNTTLYRLNKKFSQKFLGIVNEMSRFETNREHARDRCVGHDNSSSNLQYNKENPVVQKLLELDLKISLEYAEAMEENPAAVAAASA